MSCNDLSKCPTSKFLTMIMSQNFWTCARKKYLDRQMNFMKEVKCFWQLAWQWLYCTIGLYDCTIFCLDWAFLFYLVRCRNQKNSLISSVGTLLHGWLATCWTVGTVLVFLDCNCWTGIYYFYTTPQKHESTLLHTYVLNEFLTADRSCTGCRNLNDISLNLQF